MGGGRVRRRGDVEMVMAEEAQGHSALHRQRGKREKHGGKMWRSRLNED